MSKVVVQDEKTTLWAILAADAMESPGIHVPFLISVSK
jgi:hypothetical protein